MEKLTHNKRFNYYLRMLKKATGEEDWDYWARKLDRMIYKVIHS